MYGTAWKKERTTELVVKAVLAGFKGVDTACQPKHYREELVGKAISELETKHSIPRASLWIQTKYTPIGGQDMTKPLPYDPKSTIEEQVKSSVETSLRQLNVDYLDGLLLHSPIPTVELLIGACRYRAEPLVGGEWLGLGKSFWTLSGNPGLLKSPPVLQFAKRHGMTVEQILFKFCQSIGITPLSGTTNEQHMKEDVEVETSANLAAFEVEALEAALRRAGAQSN
ncbi:hypothetical protein QFC21_000997 [Naganishia friedmannii]|uniref:Uncharacterized protein n=1 Tax=Naganishia friedmannii TaxID=89922 RepID=A0ACC2W8L3_9TREE|nr:hypothetical protein QFC21_000997 [Naganishia friedmannii]